MRTTLPLVCLLLSFVGLFSTAFAGYKDRVHSSSIFQRTRYYRVITGTNFDSSGVKRYPVIYYMHGCGGTFQGDQYSSYTASGGYTPPFCSTGCVAPYTKPYNADFQAFANDNDVIIVMVDGNIPGTSGCAVWIPYQLSPGWTGNEYRFGIYMRELFHVVDSIYPTNPTPQYRAFSGLSMGGAASLWLTAQNQHLIRSMSTFCHSPSYVTIGGPNFTTYVDVTQLWRNFRGLSTRVTSNEGDYIYGMSWNLSNNLDGASLRHEYHRTTFDRHWAYHIDSQFIFHMNSFKEPRSAPKCFSAVNLYPSYDAWGWDISSNKADSGWIYLKDATASGFGLLTRKWLPFGAAMPPFPISVKTAPYYTPSGSYNLTSYDYRTGVFTTSSISADNEGRITVNSAGGMGNEFGIAGNELPVQLSMLTDTVMENIYVVSGKDTAIPATILNLSNQNISGASVVVRSKSPLINISHGSVNLGTVNGESVKKLDTLAVIRGTIDPSTEEKTATAIDAVDKRVGFISVKYTGAGVDTSKEHLIQVNMIDTVIDIDSTNVKVFDGRTENLTVFKANRFGDKNYTTSITVTEGIGNGNGRIDSGEVFSLWFRVYKYLDVKDFGTWHPVVPISGMNMPGLMFVGTRNYDFDVCRNVLSAQMKMTRVPSLQNPMEIIYKTISMKAYPATGAVRVTEGRSYQLERYYRVKFPLSLSIAAENPSMNNEIDKHIIYIKPNPFNPSTQIEFSLDEKEKSTNILLSIIASDGRIIRTFTNKQLIQNGNKFKLEWNGTDSANKPVAAGIYLIQLAYGNRQINSRAVYLP